MPTRRAARGRATVAALAGLATLGLAGCGSQTGDSAGDPGTASSSASAAVPETALLTAAEVPGFNQDYTWSAGETGTTEPPDGFGTCQRAGLTSLGATAVAVRSYRPVAGADDRAAELVAQFPDEAAARRAYARAVGWRARCADRLARKTSPRVGPLRAVGVPGGTGGWYLLTYGPVPGDPDSAYFDAQGLAVRGSRLVLVSMALAGQDYDYPPGHEPMVTAVQRAAARLS